MDCDHGNRKFAYASGLIACSLNLLILLLIQLLPKATSQVSQHVSLYAGFSALMSLAGLRGATKRDPTWTTIFANYLLLDALVFTLPRTLLIAYAATIPYNVCSHTHGPAAAATHVALRASLAYPDVHPRSIERVEMWAGRVAGLSHGQCVAVSWVVVGGAVAVVLGLTVGQWVAAVRVRRWARALVVESERPLEKGRDETVGVRHRRAVRSAV